jgi:hypothetical protein
MEMPVAGTPRAWVLVGHYFRVLALVSLLQVLSSLLRGKGVNLDFGFILLLWLGTGLIEGRAWPRRICLAICGLLTMGALVKTLSSRFASWGSPPPWAHEINSMFFDVLQAVVFLVLALPPLILLLRPSLIRESMDPEDPLRSPRWSADRFKLYLLGALVIGGMGAGRDLLTGTLTLTRQTAAFSDGAHEPRMEVLTRAKMEDSGNPDFISSWVLSDIREFSSTSGESGIVSFGRIQARPPDVRPGHFVKYLETRLEPLEQPNILLIRSDGTLIPVRRRVTLATLNAVTASARGSVDLDGIRDALELALPPVSGEFPPTHSR